MSHPMPNFLTLGIWPLEQRTCTRLSDMPHASAASFAVIQSKSINNPLCTKLWQLFHYIANLRINQKSILQIIFESVIYLLDKLRY